MAWGSPGKKAAPVWRTFPSGPPSAAAAWPGTRAVWCLLVLLRKHHCFSLFFCLWRLLTDSSLPQSCTWTVTPKTVLDAEEQGSSASWQSGLPEAKQKPGGTTYHSVCSA